MSNDGDAEASMRERLSQLGVLFLQRSAREMDSLRDLLARLRRGDSAVLEQIRYLVHKMHGTGATLGFASISEQAGKVELFLDERIAADLPVDDGMLTRLADGLALLGKEIEQAGGSTAGA